jgi:hypothetical protein
VLLKLLQHLLSGVLFDIGIRVRLRVDPVERAQHTSRVLLDILGPAVIDDLLDVEASRRPDAQWQELTHVAGFPARNDPFHEQLDEHRNVSFFEALSVGRGIRIERSLLLLCKALELSRRPRATYPTHQRQLGLATLALVLV